MSDIMASLPANGQGDVFNAGGSGASGLLTSSDQLIQWLSQTIVPALFQDAICGDGQCDADEDSGLGRFGWFYLLFFVDLDERVFDDSLFISARDCGRVALSETILKFWFLVLEFKIIIVFLSNCWNMQLQSTIQQDYAGNNVA